ncbi:SHOCT domain-containing protein [Catellatospora sichuanensis]|uniref:SHOCT domain-containing protein n=1 Tax=Catellatospora sichuanensis TaxID=1969805 RepID=UPI0016429911|nr:SHOCT domain-containing protein [Catellatospora sichuanensis]
MLLRRPAVARRGPGLLGSVARTAVVTGTAAATAGTVRRWSERRQAEAAQEQAAQQAVHDQQQQLAQPPAHADAEQPQPAALPPQAGNPEPQPAAAAPAAATAAPAAAAALGVDLMSQLKQLADLKAAGVLTDAEFTTAKAKLLGTP